MFEQSVFASQTKVFLVVNLFKNSFSFGYFNANGFEFLISHWLLLFISGIILKTLNMMNLIYLAYPPIQKNNWLRQPVDIKYSSRLFICFHFRIIYKIIVSLINALQLLLIIKVF